MKCQRCKEQDATIQIVQNHGAANQQKIILCSSCAEKLGVSVPSFSTQPEQTVNSLLNHLIGQYFGYVNKPEKRKPVESCSHCGMTVEEFRKKGRLGCSACYATFSEVLDSIFPKIQLQSTRHKGRANGEAVQVDLQEKSQLENNKETGIEKKKSVVKKKASDLSPKKTAEIQDPCKKKENAEVIAQKELLLKDAIEKENYLVAAQIRDELIAIRKSKGVKSDGKQQ